MNPPKTSSSTTPLWTRDYAVWFGADTSGALVMGMQMIAAPLVLFEVTGSTATAGVITALTGVVSLVLTVPAGVLLDRWPRRRVIVVTALAQAVIFAGGVGLYLTGHLVMTVLALILMLLTAVGTLAGPATNAALRQVVGVDNLPRAMSLNQGRDAFIQLASGPTAGLLFTLAPWLPWLVNTVASVLKSTSASFLSDPMVPPGTAARTPFWKDLGTGASFLLKNRMLLVLTIAASLINFAGTGVMQGLFLGLQLSAQTAHLVGWTATGIAIGSLLGASLSAVLVKRVGTGILLAAGFAWEAAAIVSIALAPPGILTVMLVGVIFVAIPAINAGSLGLIMAISPAELQGRVVTTISMLSMAMTPLASLAAGVGLAHLTPSILYLAFAAVSLLPALMVLVSAPLRAIPASGAWEEHLSHLTVRT
ncbi:MFS transporter [Brachybacterium sp. UMB0905]|uniref:MFS transporter n=1 Tax=Brachybacterium sp. UMB0905 TaxID=2069310 RepID=UPI0013040531|nr:MFS transporter [Brachybacterium sp. UMB0905]